MIEPHRVHWLAQQQGRGLEHMRSYTIEDLGVRGMDVFCPADFLNTAAWTSSLELLAGLGAHAVGAHDHRLVQRLLDGLDQGLYEVIGPQARAERAPAWWSSRIGSTAWHRRSLL
ncbi:MAG TPA: hypothetical protein VGO89_01410 [Streptomyces sp.]|jgi:hypothetical protein|nr:hypothetical protein [Streptomyces sp.]